MGIELEITEAEKQKESEEINHRTLLYLLFQMVSLTTIQIETFFGELEYIESRLKALGVTMAGEDARILHC